MMNLQVMGKNLYYKSKIIVKKKKTNTPHVEDFPFKL